MDRARVELTHTDIREATFENCDLIVPCDATFRGCSFDNVLIYSRGPDGSVAGFGEARLQDAVSPGSKYIIDRETDSLVAGFDVGA